MWSIVELEVIEPELCTYLDRIYIWEQKNTRLEFWDAPMFKGMERSDHKGE